MFAGTLEKTDLFLANSILRHKDVRFSLPHRLPTVIAAAVLGSEGMTACFSGRFAILGHIALRLFKGCPKSHFAILGNQSKFYVLVLHGTRLGFHG